MHENTEKTLTRDCPATRIPSGEAITLAKGTSVFITQALGGSYTVATDQGLARIADEDADALGLERMTAPKPRPPRRTPAARWTKRPSGISSAPATTRRFPSTSSISASSMIASSRRARRDGAKVDVKMTLTAPGCGMGPTIAAEAKSKVLSVPGVGDADVELVWDPPWNQAMISEAGKMKLGLI